RIIGEYQIDLPRPRHETERGLVDLSNVITERFSAPLRAEMEQERRHGE
ncbi:MAG: hypothetical protein HY901_00570, partial [Deltaproteobacteria bacterium]|nr:hypothetical protein [Deltaproteobacteria bacterium]